MNDALTPDTATLLDNLHLLCAQPSVAGQPRALADGADAVATVLRGSGLDCRIVTTPGAPVVIGRYNAGAARTLLVYGRYDIPPAGLRRSWTSDPFQPTLRHDALYARGAVVKAELVARAAAIQLLIAQQLPLNVVVVVEGESLAGSPHLAVARESLGAADVGLWSGGGYDASGTPLLYTGLKGLLQVELAASSATAALPGSYAATVPNPLWTLTLALASIKSEFEEILIDGFYDEIMPPSRTALNTVQRLDVGEQARRDAWGVNRFLAGVSGAMLARTETFSPTCNISAINVSGAGVAAIPARASAELQFQLVPDHQPARLFEMLTAHLQARGLDDLAVRQLPGAYGPFQSPVLPFDAAQATVQIHGQPATVVPLSSFAAPAALLLDAAPLVGCGLERPTSALLGTDEHVPLADLLAHTRLVIELITRIAV